MSSGDPLRTWRDGPTKLAILDFVERVATDGVPPEERIAVFDNDGTLWCEQPMPIQLDFVLRQLVSMAQDDPTLRSREPWRAAYAADYEWLNGAITKHYHGDDGDLQTFAAGMLAAFAGITVSDFEAKADGFLRTAQHPSLGRGYLACSYTPMVELLGYLAANGFRNYIVSGGGRDFIRPVSSDIYGIPRERVIGSSATLAWERGTIVHKPAVDVVDDGPEKPVRIWNRVGRGPLLAAGNSNGDIPMLQYAKNSDRPSLSLLLRHDDEAREFDYRAGAEDALDAAGAHGWTVISMKDDWTTVF